MSNIMQFVLPANKSELLNETGTSYYVRDVITISEIISKLKESRLILKEEGAYFILSNFDTYFSVLHHGEQVPINVVFQAYQDLLRAVRELNNTIGFLLEDKENNINDENRDQMLNTMKMLLYIFIQIVTYISQQSDKKRDAFLSKSKKVQNQKSSDDKFNVNKSEVINAINTILQREINTFWDPPIVEHEFIKMIGELGFYFLQNQGINKEKELRNDIYGMFGNLVKSYDFGETFVMRLIQNIRLYEHFVRHAPEGVKLLIEQFNCKSLIHHFVKEATEWQVDENMHQDNQGARSCSQFLTELAEILPNLMIPEIAYLNQYLHQESVPLRISVINVISEVLMKVLNKHDLTDNLQKSRDEFFDILMEHINDSSGLVRAKVIQNFSRLQKEMAVPLKFHEKLLQELLEHLYDRTAGVRKMTIGCLTTFIEHNPYGVNLRLRHNEEELARIKESLNKFESTYKEARIAKMEELENFWNSIKDELKSTVKNLLDDDASDDEDSDNNEQNAPLDKELLVDSIRSHLKEKKYAEAFKISQKLRDSFQEWRDLAKTGVSEEEECDLYVRVMNVLFMDRERINEEIRLGAGMTEDEIKEVQMLEKGVGFLEKMVGFLRVIDQAVDSMKKLLFTPTISDMHEAIEFIRTAHAFKIDNINSAVLAMLEVMQHNEPERKENIIEAFKKIYLVTSSKDMKEHTETILQRLISLLKELPHEHYNDLLLIVSEWTAKGILDNAVIDMCWQYYTKRAPVSDSDSLAVTDLLRMAAIGRRTILSKNVKVVSTIACSERGRNDMLFLSESCRLLAVMGREKVDVNSSDPPLKIDANDEVFASLNKILIDRFFDDVPYYSKAMESALDFIFKTCTRPLMISENLLKGIFKQIPNNKMRNLIYVRICDVLGFLAMQILGFLDGPLYKELKRRNNIREERKQQKNKQKSNKKKNSRKSVIVSDSAENESILEGAQAEDTDAEYILHVIDNDLVSGSGTLGKFLEFLKKIAQNPDIFNNIHIQRSAIVSLMRFMLVSSKVCSDNIRLIFTIFEKSTFPEIKCAILLHLSDFLTRYPNIIEPWSPRIYERLKDPLVEVRRTAFHTLSSLILRDMIRAHSHMSEMALCMIDKEEDMRENCKQFFIRLSQKENNLVNVVPDIFAHLIKMDLDKEDLRSIMKFLFGLLDKTKRMENLVDRFCAKFSPTEADLNLNQNIAFCLSLIDYNDKALKKLQEKFTLYKHLVHDAEIYAFFNQITTEASKQKPGKTDLKPIATEIDNLIASVFELREDGQMRPPPLPLKAPKNNKGRGRKKTPAKRRSDSDDDFETSNSINSSARSTNKRVKRTKASRKRIADSSSDSD